MTKIKILFLITLFFLIGQELYAQKNTPNREKNGMAESMVFENESCNEGDAYMQIGDKKYYDGDKAFICANGDTKIYAFQENGQALSDLGVLWWKGAIPSIYPEDGANVAILEEIEVSSSLIGTPVVVSVDDIEINIRVVTVEITYSYPMDETWGGPSGGGYGFDDNASENTSVYPSHATSPEPGIVWKSIEIGNSDKLDYIVNPLGAGAGAGNNMDFTHGEKIDLIPNDNVNPGMGSVNIIGGQVGESFIYIEEGAGACYANTVTYNPKYRTVGIITVNSPEHQNEFVVNTEAIQVELNKVYSQAVFQWTVLNLGSETIDYDRYPMNGFLDSDDPTRERDEQGYFIEYSREMVYIWENSSQVTNNRSRCDNFIFIVDRTALGDERENSLGGQNIIGENFGFMKVDGSVLSGHPSVLPENVLGHELGHSVGLRHPFSEALGGFGSQWRGKDPSNIMEYGDFSDVSIVDFAGGGLLRKYQWDKLQDIGL